MLNKNKCLKYQCDNCSENHDDYDDARECCKPEIHEVYVCPFEGCEKDFDDFKDLAVHYTEHDADDRVMSYPRLLSLHDSPFLGEWEYAMYADAADNSREVPLLIPDEKKLRIVQQI